ncbi:putative nucleotidyltransferase, Ribonuclease H [Rosa chinensis]|uniref:Putative nucleotidyltransferase, Ribonuclease H n=1 Tax=Rosa chinensis TaxID=74649 RepID=A0A2P6QSH2_ROSCH|nr:putative nucleotidyltransferase, Ribonuclease H [Rosa chinensis]
MSNCEFGTSTVEYLGHIISAQGVAVDPVKIEIIRKWAKPKTLKGLRGFLGMASYYRKFVPNFGIIAKPLTNMFKKDSFVWSPEAERAFEELKLSMTTTPVLAQPDFDKEFVVECDASCLGIGVVLSQDKHPIAFLSKTLAHKYLGLSIYDKEMLAVVYAVQHWRPYLLGHHFKIITDHRTLQHFLDQRITTPAQQKWFLKLIGYDYSIAYRSGPNNVVPDALSQQAELMSLMGVSTPIFKFMEDLQSLCENDAETRTLIDEVQRSPATRKNFTYRDGRLYYKGRFYVPEIAQWRERIMKEFHEGKEGGHSGWLRTYKRVSRNFLWLGVKKMIKIYVSECIICQQNHYEAVAPPGLLQPNPIPQGAWLDISLDFIDGLPNHEGMSTILVVVDRLTKYGHFIALSHPYTAKSVATAFVHNVFKLHGMPKTMITDRDPIFLSAFWKSFFALQGTQLCKSTAYHPQTEGQTESLNKVLEQYLRCSICEKKGNRPDMLPWAEWWYNSTYHSAIKMSPFQALYGISPLTIQTYMPGTTAVHQVDLQLRDRDERLKILQHNIQLPQNRMKVYYDKYHTEREFAVGDMIFLKLQPYRQSSIQKRKSQKLAPRYFGPYQVTAKIGKVAYKLQLPASAKIHPMFHVSLLKKKLGSSVVPRPHLPPILDSDKSHWYPNKILDRGMFKKGNSAEIKWFVQWENSIEDDATWMNADEFMHKFPDFKT